jgi:hypothetical protein
VVSQYIPRNETPSSNIESMSSVPLLASMDETFLQPNYTAISHLQSEQATSLDIPPNWTPNHVPEFIERKPPPTPYNNFSYQPNLGMDLVLQAEELDLSETQSTVSRSKRRRDINMSIPSKESPQHNHIRNRGGVSKYVDREVLIFLSPLTSKPCLGTI